MMERGTIFSLEHEGGRWYACQDGERMSNDWSESSETMDAYIEGLAQGISMNRGTATVVYSQPGRRSFTFHEQIPDEEEIEV